MKFTTNNRIQEQQNNSNALAIIIDNRLNTIRNIKKSSESIKNRIGKQYNKIPNLILAVIAPHN